MPTKSEGTAVPRISSPREHTPAFVAKDGQTPITLEDALKMIQQEKRREQIKRFRKILDRAKL